jgi:hypothetical protein
MLYYNFNQSDLAWILILLLGGGGERGGDWYHVQRGEFPTAAMALLRTRTVRTVHPPSATDAKHSSMGAFTADFKIVFHT